MTLASFTDTPPLGVHWPFYLWLIDFLTLSTCGGPGCKRYIVLVTYLFPSIHFPARVLAEAKICEDIQTQTDPPPPPRLTHLPSLYISTHMHSTTLAPKSPISRVSFRPLRTDQAQLWLERSWGSGGGQTEQTLREPNIGSQVTPSSPSGVKGHGSQSHCDASAG